LLLILIQHAFWLTGKFVYNLLHKEEGSLILKWIYSFDEN